jgi:hypothetical protein
MIIKALVRLNKHTDKYKTYYAFIEIAIVMWLFYMFGGFNLLHTPGITQHFSNLIGTIVLMLLLIGPISFRSPGLHKMRIYITVAAVITLNLVLELINPITSIDSDILYWESFNTPDYMDAVYGLLGVFIVAIVLFLQKRQRIHHNRQRGKTIK